LAEMKTVPKSKIFPYNLPGYIKPNVVKDS